MEDIEIARNTELKEISEITDELDIPSELTAQQKNLIDTLNDRIIMGINNPENEESYSKYK